MTLFFGILFVITLASASYHAVVGGFSISVRDRWWAVGISTVLLALLLISYPLTWFGWLLVGVFTWDGIVALVYALRGQTKHKSDTSCFVTALICLLFIVLSVIVGVVA